MISVAIINTGSVSGSELGFEWVAVCVVKETTITTKNIILNVSLMQDFERHSWKKDHWNMWVPWPKQLRTKSNHCTRVTLSHLNSKEQEKSYEMSPFRANRVHWPKQRPPSWRNTRTCFMCVHTQLNESQHSRGAYFR